MLYTLGLNHQTAPLAVRERVVFHVERLCDALGQLKQHFAREAAILRLARHLEGRLSVADVALATGLTLQASEAALNQLVRKGYAELQVSPSGVLIYHCFPLANDRDKSRAERVLS